MLREQLTQRNEVLAEQCALLQQQSTQISSLAGSQAFARIRGYLSTLRKQGVPLLSALHATLGGHPILSSLLHTWAVTLFHVSLNSAFSCIQASGLT